MQARFKFRAKRVDNNKFVCGYLCFVYTDNKSQCKIYNQDNVNSYDCYTETIGQCTGLKDKNGKLIYEGDVLRYRKEEYNDEWKKSKVVWSGDYDYPAFDIDDIQFDTSNGLSYLIGDNWEFEVIGNIYENPELLEQGANQ